MKRNTMALANTFSLATGILWVGCTGFVLLFPQLSRDITTWWLHGLDITVMGDWDITFSNVLFGGITLMIAAWAAGWVFGWSWERMKAKR